MEDSKSEIEGIERSASRIVTDSTYSAKRHFNTGASLDGMRYALGGLIVGTSVLATSQAVAPGLIPIALLGLCSVGAAILAGLVTVYNPGGRAVRHSKIGADYLALRKDTQHFLDVDLIAPGSSPRQLKAKLEELLNRQKFIDRESALNPTPPRAYKEAKEGIERGEARY